MHKKVLITGTAGFIGFHLAKRLLKEGFQVHGYDGMTDYYDVNLKRRRHQMLLQNEGFAMTEGLLEDNAKFSETAHKFTPDIIIHLAAQAGVRYSLENPRSYIWRIAMHICGIYLPPCLGSSRSTGNGGVLTLRYINL